MSLEQSWQSWFKAGEQPNPPRLPATSVADVRVGLCDALARQQALEVFASSGVCCVEQALPQDIVDLCYAKSVANMTELMAKRDALLQSVLRRDQGRSFDDEEVDLKTVSFHEIEGLTGGRLDMRYKMLEPPFNAPELINEAPWLQFVQSLLGGDACLMYAGVMVAQASSSFNNSCPP